MQEVIMQAMGTGVPLELGPFAVLIEWRGLPAPARFGRRPRPVITPRPWRKPPLAAAGHWQPRRTYALDL